MIDPLSKNNTREQAYSDMWRELRKGRVTASVIKRVYAKDVE